LDVLRTGPSFDLYDGEQQMAYARSTGYKSAIIVINNDTKPATITFDMARIQGYPSRWTDRLGVSPDVTTNGSMMTVNMPKRSASIFVVK
jgi:hypothetical protein